jgi:hypothetical protein
MSHLRRLCALVAVGTLTFAGLTVAGAPAQAATPDPRPLTIGATWLESQLTGGLIHNQQFDFDDYGLTIDAGLSLAAVGGHATAVDAISTAIAANIGSYTSYPGHTLAGSIAKAASFALAAGDDPTAYGGKNLITDLESRVAGSAPIVGRIQDDFTPGPFESDFANVIGQAFAARALSAEGSGKASDVVSFLLQQQCSAGFFRLYFNPDPAATDQSCDGGATGESAPDTDATALTVLQLRALASPPPAVSAAIDDAEAWLLGAQRADGSFGGGASTEAPNTDSTGLAGWVLGVLGDDTAAARAATWVRSHQADEPTACPNALSNQTGALGYDDAAVAAGRADGITTPTQDQWRRATAPSLPVLQWAPPASSPFDVSGPTGYVQAGTTVGFQVSGAAPGTKVCISGVGAPRTVVAPSSGSFPVSVAMPAGTADHVVVASVRKGDSAGFQVRALGATTLRVRPARDTVHRGARLRLVVRGLAPGESVTLRVRGVTVRSGNADLDGTFVKRVRPGHRLGKVRIVARGEFPAIRHGRAVVRVVR